MDLQPISKSSEKLVTRLMTAILPREYSRIQLVYAQSFLGGAMLLLMTVVAHGLLITHAGTAQLPLAFVISALVFPIFSFLVNRLRQRITFAKLFPAVWITLTGLTVLFWGLFLFLPVPQVVIGLFVFHVVFLAHLAQLQSMMLGQLGDEREFKTEQPKLLAAMLAGVVLFALIVRPWVTLFGDLVHLLLLVAAGGCAMHWVWRKIIANRPEQFLELPNSLDRPEMAAISAVRRQPLVRSILGYKFLSSLVSGLILFIFLTQVGQYFSDSPEAIPAFFASFIAFVSLVSVGMLLYLIQPLIKKAGLNFGLITNPIAVATTLIALIVITPLVPPAASLILWLAALLRAADLIFSFSTSDPTLQAIYQIISVNDRGKIINGVNGISLPLGLAVAGVLLWVATSLPDFRWVYVLALTAAACVAWAFAGWQTFRQYADTLQERLNRRMLDEVELALDNAETVSHVEKLIGSGNPVMIRLALNLLKNDRHPSYHSRLVGLLNYRNENILTDVLVRIEEERLTHLQSTLEKLFERHSSGRVKGRILRTLSACNPEDSGDFVQEYIEDDDPDVQLGSLVGLLKYGGLPNSVYAGMRLVEINKQTDKESQIYGAKILESIGASGFYQPIVDQLNHGDIEVRLAGLQASTEVINGRLVPPIIENLACPDTRSAAVAALLAHGTHVVPVAEEILSDDLKDDPDATGYSPVVKARLARVLGEVEGAEAEQILLKNLSHPIDKTRSAVLNSLRRRGYTPQTPAEKERVNGQILAELEQAASLIAIQRDLKLGKHSLAHMAHLNDALVIEQTNQKDRIFNLLALLYDRHSIWSANEQLTWARGPQKTLADEALEVILSDTHNRQISIMIEPDVAPAERLEILSRWVDVEDELPEKIQLQGLIADQHSTSWTRACAIYAAGKSGHDSLLPELEACMQEDDVLVCETAKGAIAELTGDDTLVAEENHMLMIEKVAILKAASIFKETPGNVLASVAAIVKEIPLEANETFIKQGDASNELYLVVEGEVEAVINGKSIIKLGQGQTVGELGIFNQETRSADVRTLAPTLLFSIERDALNQLMADRPEIAQGIIGALSRRIREQGQLMSQAG